jgi:hypothetical protein
VANQGVASVAETETRSEGTNALAIARRVSPLSMGVEGVLQESVRGPDEAGATGVSRRTARRREKRTNMSLASFDVKHRGSI